MPHKDPEALKAYYREYRRKWNKANPEKVRATSSRYYAKHREKVNEYQKSWRSRRTEGYLLSAARRRAKVKGLAFNLTIEDIVVPLLCPALGIPIRREAEKWADDVPTLDRIDSSKGYVKGNVMVISKRANFLKNDASVEEVRSLLRYMESACPHS